MSNNIDYKKSLNLPRTGFSMKANLSQKEPGILELWEKEDIYARVREKRKGRKKYILHDGPPYANGDIHLGHALNKTLKDIVVRFHLMLGEDVPFIPGWDCHGLPVEHQLFKELGITKHQISQLEFRRKAHAYASKFVNVQKEEFKRLGILADFAHPYLTLDPKYEAEVIGSFAKLAEKGFIYKGVKPVNWCINCETALAEAEVEYQAHSSPSIYVKFKLLGQDKLSNINRSPSTALYFLVWTTTPWTLISNVAVAVNPGFEYCLIKLDKEILLVASNRLDAVAEKLKISEYSILKKIKGSELEGLQLRHPFFERDSKVLLADFVSAEEGTGCVHIAPGHGEEDYNLGKAYNLSAIMPVDNKGIFNKDAGKFSGLDVFSANAKIIEELKNKGVLALEERLEHSYPHCWRCKRPVIFRATAQWFMSIDHLQLREKAKDIVKRIKWFPPSGENRIIAMLNTRPDWCLSRQRYWGVPIPIFYCKDCGEILLEGEVIEYISGLVRNSGSDIWFAKEEKDLLPPGTKCRKCNGNNFGREKSIVDVWFESGVSHQAVLRNDRELAFPADLYLEGSDQHRGWFQTSLLTSMGIKGEAPFKAVLTHGFVVDGEGRKMSKSLGNVISPRDIVDKFGADVLRLWTISSDFSEDIKISAEILERVCDVYRKWRNTAKFILGNLFDFVPQEDKLDYSQLLDIDKWALADAQELLKKVLDCYKFFEFHKIYRLIYQFCLIDMSAIYLDIIKDRLYTFKAGSLERRSSQTAIYEILNILLRLWAPLIPFTAEEVWKYFPREKKLRDVNSVHMLRIQEVNQKWLDYNLLKQWEPIWKIRDVVLRSIERERAEKIIGNSLEAEVVFFVADEKLHRYLKRYSADLSALFLVSQVRINRVDEIPLNSFRDEELVPKFGIEVKKAQGNKCLRCWNYSLSVGKDGKHSNLCGRCVAVLEEMET